jgi:hypothetical protein
MFEVGDVVKPISGSITDENGFSHEVAVVISAQPLVLTALRGIGAVWRDNIFFYRFKKVGEAKGSILNKCLERL